MGAGRSNRGSPCEVSVQMGHRAPVAYERTDGQYTLHYSQWGATNLKLKHRVSAESPFGGDNTDSKWGKQLLAELAEGLEADAVDGYLTGEDRPSTVVEPKPHATDLTLGVIIAKQGPPSIFTTRYLSGPDDFNKPLLGRSASWQVLFFRGRNG